MWARIIKWAKAIGWLFVGFVLSLPKLADYIGRSTLAEDLGALGPKMEAILDWIAREPAWFFYGLPAAILIVLLSPYVASLAKRLRSRAEARKLAADAALRLAVSTPAPQAGRETRSSVAPPTAASDGERVKVVRVGRPPVEPYVASAPDVPPLFVSQDAAATIVSRSQWAADLRALNEPPLTIREHFEEVANAGILVNRRKFAVEDKFYDWCRDALEVFEQDQPDAFTADEMGRKKYEANSLRDWLEYKRRDNLHKRFGSPH